jgi:parvulin-like peptidyl-prolyl isomerase
VTRTTRLAAAGLAALLLAGCGGGPTRAGAAATVGDERIRTDDLQAVVDRGLANPEAEQQFGGDRAEFQRLVLNRMVRAELLEAAAEQEGVEVTQGDVDARIEDFAQQAGGREALEEQAAAGGISATDLPVFAREIALEEELGDALTEGEQVPQEQLEAAYQQNIGQFQTVRARHILVEDEATARAVLAEVQADPSRFPAVAAERSTDTGSAEQGGDLGEQGRGTFVPEFDSAVFTQPLNTPFVVQTQFGWHVVEVLERQETSLAEASEQLERQVLGEERATRVQQLLQQTAERLGVVVNPRFGTWDPEALEVAPVPADDGLSSPAPGEPAPADPAAPPVGEAPAQPEAPVESPAS